MNIIIPVKKLISILLFCTLCYTLCAQNKEADSLGVYSVADVMPQAPYDWGAYLKTHLHYPQVAMENNIEGKVYISFIVEEDGRITNVAVKKGQGLGGGLPEEAVLLIANMPKWQPAMIAGKAVCCYYTIPVNFKLIDENDEVYTKVDFPPHPLYDWNQFIAHNLKYPPKSRDKHIQGKVYITFIVAQNGMITDVAIHKEEQLDPKLRELAEEGLRVIRSMPPWQPGLQKGVPVRCYFTVPINFRLFGIE